jgi:hypothetical protein
LYKSQKNAKLLKENKQATPKKIAQEAWPPGGKEAD